jgi:uncharacterized LabA/DUF88 family protein
MIRFAIFVDGSNLFGCLRDMNLRVEDYQGFYRYIFDEAVGVWRETAAAATLPPLQLRRVYWYEVGSIDEWDLADPKAQVHLHERFENDREQKRAYFALAGEKLKGASQEAVAKEAWAMCFREFQDWYEKKRSTLEGMRRFHHAIRGSTDFVDVVECGHWKVDFLHRTVTEKGLDASLAVDMVALADNYDVALVLSGDADSIPSINYIKTRNKHVGVVEFVSGYPPDRKGKSFSSRLGLAADFVVRIYEMSLVAKNLGQKPPPTSVAGGAA